jgi:hypothetical protein
MTLPRTLLTIAAATALLTTPAGAQMLPPGKGVINIDPGKNGGVTVKGWSRNEVPVRARIETAAPSESEARSLVPQVRVASGASQIHAEGPSGDNDHYWPVTYEIFVPHQSDIDAKAHNGGVKMSVPSNYSAHLETGTTNGGMDVDFPVTVQGKLSKDMSFNLGNGGATVRVMTTNGGVKIQRS